MQRSWNCDVRQPKLQIHINLFMRSHLHIMIVVKPLLHPLFEVNREVLPSLHAGETCCVFGNQVTCIALLSSSHHYRGFELPRTYCYAVQIRKVVIRVQLR